MAVLACAVEGDEPAEPGQEPPKAIPYDVRRVYNKGRVGECFLPLGNTRPLEQFAGHVNT